MNLEKKLITPQLAKVLLEKNTINRKPTSARIAFYADQMLAGNWMADTCEFIKIAEDGTLIDGQNRLMAIIKADKPIELLVATGVPKSAIDFIDTGKSRSAGDLLTMNNIANGSKRNTIIQAINRAKNNVYYQGGGKNKALSNYEVLKEYKNNSDYYDSIIYHLELLRKKAPLRTFTATWLAMIIFKLNNSLYIKNTIKMNYLQEQKDYNYTISPLVLDFLRSIFFHEPTNESQKLLINTFVKDLSTNKKLGADIKLAYIFKVWNATITNKTLRVLKFNKEIEPFPEPK